MILVWIESRRAHTERPSCQQSVQFVTVTPGYRSLPLTRSCTHSSSQSPAPLWSPPVNRTKSCQMNPSLRAARLPVSPADRAPPELPSSTKFSAETSGTNPCFLRRSRASAAFSIL
eukprot:Amastigsp_a679500_26.p4 type:complete len:116 gc:universal Amastigsp_a679500_26:576-229(-)